MERQNRWIGGWNRRSAIRVVCLLFSGWVPIAAAEPLAAKPDEVDIQELIDDIFESIGVGEEHKESLFAGEIVYTGMPELEVIPEELAVAGVVLLVQAPISAVVDRYLREDAFREDETILEYERIETVDNPDAEGEETFEAVGFTPGEKKEIKRLLHLEPGYRFNFSAGEIARFEAIDPKQEESAVRVAQVYRAVLEERCRSYRRSGIAAIQPYARKRGRESSPAREMSIAVETATLLERHFPGFHAALLRYPERDVPGLLERFFWLKKVVAERPAFVLAHQMLEVRPDWAIGAEREYYVGHSYNSLLTLIGAVPFESGILVFGVNRTFTDQVTGVARGMKKEHGRKLVARKLAQRFEGIRSVLEGQADDKEKNDPSAD
jgi:hypothetical protein